MKRSTRKSSVFLPPTSSVVEQKHIPGSSFDTKFSLPSFTRRVEKLTEDQRASIYRTGFGNLLKIHNQMISKVLLDVLMERWESEKMSFNLLHRKLTITPEDVALILGLRAVGKSVILDEPFSDLEKMYGATPSNRKISISVIEERLESIGGLANDDFVRSFLMYTFGVFLFPNSSGKVDSVYLTLLKDLDKVSEYAWGEAVRHDLFSWIKRRTEENVRWVGGCLLLLQIWCYEHIDIGRPNLLASERFPRASRWESRSSFQRQWLCTRFNKLEEHQITWVLHPTTSESEIDVVKHFLDTKAPKEEALLGQSTDSSSGIIEFEECATCHPDAKEAQCGANEDESKNVDYRQDCIPESSSAAASEITQCHLKAKETVDSQKDLGKNMQFRMEFVSQAESGITQGCSETKETAESPYTQNPDSEEGVEMEDVISEASGASLDIALEVSESPEIWSYIDKGDRLPILSQRLASVSIQDSKELKKAISQLLQENLKVKEDNMMLNEKNLKVNEEKLKVKEENMKLNEENSKVKEDNMMLNEKNLKVNEEKLKMEEDKMMLNEENLKVKEENMMLNEENLMLKEEKRQLKAKIEVSKRCDELVESAIDDCDKSASDCQKGIRDLLKINESFK